MKTYNMNSTYDIIIIGGGHNGLTAATTLAKKNKKVLLLEKRAILGGIAAGEAFFPGYRAVGLLHDTSSVRKKVIDELGLENFGLKTAESGPEVNLLSKDGRSVTLYADTEKTCAEIAKISQKDADEYRVHRSFIEKISGFIQGLLNDIPPDLINLGGKQLWELLKKGFGLKKLGKKTMMEFLKVAPMSVADYLDEKFETDFIKAGIAGPAIYGSYTSPRASYTTLNLLLWECTASQRIVGGPQALIAALAQAAQEAGVTVKTDAEVDKILLENTESVAGVKLKNGDEFQAKCVVSSCSPSATFLDLLAPNLIAYSLAHEIELFRSRGTTAKVNLALDRAVQLNSKEAMFYRTGNSFLEMEKSFDPSKYRQFSPEPILDIHIPTLENASLAPEGHHVLSILVHYAPYEIENGWSKETRQQLLDNVIKTLKHYSPDISSKIVGAEVLSPVDLEDRYNLPQGHIFHGEHAIDQLITRPIPVCARYKTPINGLYLCGSGSHPGGGITCMPGYLGAKMILRSLF